VGTFKETGVREASKDKNVKGYIGYLEATILGHSDYHE
jgi:hypothetical protein